MKKVLFTAILFLSACSLQNAEDIKEVDLKSDHKDFTKDLQNKVPNENKEKKSGKKISFLISSIPNILINMQFNELNCNIVNFSNNDILGYKEHFDDNDNISEYISNYCKERFKSNYIDQKNFNFDEGVLTNKEMFVTQSDKENDYSLMLLQGRNPDVAKKEIEEYIGKYNDYFNEESLVLHKVSLYLEDFQEDEVARRYLTKNIYNLKMDELKFWNFCEAGCKVWPEDIMGEYILWKFNLDPATGAGDKCWSASGKPAYNNLNQQLNCEFTSAIAFDLLENMQFSLVK